ncbi:hypothetical protein [Arcicella rosea]|uniref:Uncharacterized protein n=1 Tax=Arcicella rosea TaxID=502909 RepID=A0A841ENM8_9BACT|nr:hypothetical protein [Arcicella rosea]MBB6002338.1 hypothetical protein [Arcicella rosea]
MQDKKKNELDSLLEKTLGSEEMKKALESFESVNSIIKHSSLSDVLSNLDFSLISRMNTMTNPSQDKNNPIHYSPSAHLKNYNPPPHFEKRMEVSEKTKQVGVKLTHFEIALLFHYKNEIINRDNSDRIANFYQQGSGIQLLEKVEEFKNYPNRIKEHRFSKRYHEKIISLLEGNEIAKENAKKTLNEIQSKKV